MDFTDLGLSPQLLEAVRLQGYTTPSPIQLQAIPAVLKGRDVMAAAQTGTGKTAAFTLPLLQRLSEGQKAGPKEVRALVLTPTRELAAQVAASVDAYGSRLPLRSAVVFGGVGINPQINALRKGVDVLIATPGRLLDLYSQGVLTFKRLEILVLDEADRMLDMGFIHDIRRILALLPARRQNLMFSATFSDDVRKLAKGLVHQAQEISVTPRNTAAETVQQRLYRVEKSQKTALLLHLISTQNWSQVLVFTRTKHGADRLARILAKAGIGTAAIHGNKGQGARTRALEGFKNGALQVLVATDIAARGLDIEQLPWVVNFDLPNVPEDYVHRIGRTGRAGASGQAVSLVGPDEAGQLADIEKLIGRRIEREALPALPAGKPSAQAGAVNTAPTSAGATKTAGDVVVSMDKPGPAKKRRRRNRSAAAGKNPQNGNGSAATPRNRPQRKGGNKHPAAAAKSGARHQSGASRPARKAAKA
ncbi:MAG TPA: DEAD/DEAH box helicase [Thiolinea sp.]|nr:DEAD/DEAH box helicase [Thiolinea sp.]